MQQALSNLLSQLAYVATGFQRAHEARVNDLIEIDLSDFRIYPGDNALHDPIRRRIRRQVEGRHQAQHFVRRLAFFGSRQPKILHQSPGHLGLIVAVEDKRRRFGEPLSQTQEKILPARQHFF